VEERLAYYKRDNEEQTKKQQKQHEQRAAELGDRIRELELLL